MAHSYNNEHYAALEHRDIQANAMAVDNTGTYVLLAGCADLTFSLCFYCAYDFESF